MKTLKHISVVAVIAIVFIITPFSPVGLSTYASNVISLPSSQEEKQWEQALNAFNDRTPDSEELLREFVGQYPAGLHTNRARLLLADIQFFKHNWPDALSLYNQANISGLTGNERSLYSYRKALCLIKTGYFREARRMFGDIKGSQYKDIRNYYTAYLDYIAGDFKSAYKGFEKVPSGIDGLSPEYYLAQIDYSRGEYNKVAGITNRLIKSGMPEELSAETYRINGMSAFKLGQYNQARRSLLKYQELNRGSESPEALYALGVIDYTGGNYRRAARYFRPVTEENGELGQSAWLYIGQCRLQDDDIQGATLAFEKASAYRTDPEVAQTAMYNYVTALTRGGNIPFSKSAQLLESFLSRWPDSEHASEVEQYLATAYLNDHNNLKAIELVNKAAHPTSTMLEIKQRALYEQGVQQAVNGDARGSIPYFKQCAQMRDVNAELSMQARLWLADAEYNCSQYGNAAENYAIFIKNSPASYNRSLAIYNLAYSLFQQKNYREAAEEFNKAITATPSLGLPTLNDARMRRADCLYYIGKYNEAVDLFGELKDSNIADSDYAAYRYATTVGRAKGAREKIEALQTFISRYPESKWLSAALLEKALTHEELGETPAAAECYRRRLAITPDADVDELWRAADANDIASTAPEEQLKILDKIIRAGNTSADELAQLNLYRANALHRLGRTSEANALYLELSKNPAGEAGAKAAVTLANNLIKHHQYQQALDLMTEFTDAGTPHQYWLARGFIAMADCYKALDRPELAIEYLESLRDNYPYTDDDILTIIDQRLNDLKR